MIECRWIWMRCMLRDKMCFRTEDELIMLTHLFPWGLKSFLHRNSVRACRGEGEVDGMNERVGRWAVQAMKELSEQE